MKWYWWILIIAIILIITSYLIYKNKPDGKKIVIDSLNGQFGDVLQESFANDSRDIVQNLIDKKYSFEQIKSEAVKRGIIVLDSKETHTLEYNPKRVILEVIQINCLVPPCYPIIRIQSIG